VIAITARTLRARWLASAGTLLVLMLGTGLITVMTLALFAALSAPRPAPQRYAAAPVVVRPWTAQAPVPPGVLANLAAAGRVIPDRTFYAQLAGGPADEVGHPWSAAAFTPYSLTAGRAPAADNQVVVTENSGAHLGDSVTVLTAAGPRRYLVAGLTAPIPFENAVFFTDAQAARLSPAVDAAVVYATPAAARHAAGGRAQVLAGADRWMADPAAAAYRQELRDTATLVGVSGGIAAFVAIFVVASAFAFAVTQRRREFALLRTVGCTPRQVRRLVITEAALTAAAGSSTGCLLGLLAAPWFARLLISAGIAPDSFAVTPSAAALGVGFVTGFAVALLGAWASSRTAGRVPAIEALREAVVNTTAMSRARWIWGLSILVCAAAACAWIAAANPRIATVPQMYPGVPILVLLAVALLAPAVIGPLTRLLCWPLTGRVSAMLAKESTLTGIRRTAHTAVPVLLAVGLAVSLLGSIATLRQATQTGLQRLVRADYVIVPDGTPGLNTTVISRIRAVPGTETSTQTTTDVYGPGSRGSVRSYHASFGDQAELADTLAIPLVSGSLAGLTAASIVVSTEWNARIGQQITVRFADGQAVSLRVAGVFKPGIDSPDAYLSARHAQPALADQVFVKVRPGTAPATVGAALDDAVRGLGARVVPASNWAGWSMANERSSLLGMLLTLGITAVYSLIAVVSITVMAAAGRRAELALRCLAGITKRQVLRQVAAESLLVAAIGLLLAGMTSAANLEWVRTALSALVGSTPIRVPWVPALAFAAGGAALIVTTSVLTTLKMLRGPALQLASQQE
jgi:putative ABC transport system permease protein